MRGPAIPLLQFSNWRNLTHFLWLPDGRLIYARGEESENLYCNFWELRIDPLSQWAELNVFCSDGAVPIDNNNDSPESK